MTLQSFSAKLLRALILLAPFYCCVPSHLVFADDILGEYSFDDPRADHIEMGITWGEQQRPDLAALAFEAACEFEPLRVAAWINLALARLSLGELDGAVTAILAYANQTRTGDPIPEHYRQSFATAALTVAEELDIIDKNEAGAAAAAMFAEAIIAERRVLTSDQLVSAGLALFFHGTAIQYPSNELLLSEFSSKNEGVSTLRAVRLEALKLMRSSLLKLRGPSEGDRLKFCVSEQASAAGGAIDEPQVKKMELNSLHDVLARRLGTPRLHKLRFDIDQYEYLAQKYSENNVFFESRRDAAQRALENAVRRKSMQEGGDPDDFLSAADLVPVAQSFGRPEHVRTGESYGGVSTPPKVMTGEGLEAANAEWAAADLNKPKPIIVVDNVLTPEALEATRSMLMDSTIWFDGAKPGYVAAYVNDGLASEVLLLIAEELKAALPSALSDHRLWHLWAYSYEGASQGIGIHADFAAVNVNMWLTPDSANLRPDRGGLVVFHRRPPAGAHFSDYNCSPDEGYEACVTRLHEFIAAGCGPGEGGEEDCTLNTTIPYRANRMVIFDSQLLHATDEFDFKAGYQNRRINLTYLFGKGGSWQQRQ